MDVSVITKPAFAVLGLEDADKDPNWIEPLWDTAIPLEESTTWAEQRAPGMPLAEPLTRSGSPGSALAPIIGVVMRMRPIYF
jgi:hypothetical protein